jgi:hypothetical protein
MTNHGFEGFLQPETNEARQREKTASLSGDYEPAYEKIQSTREVRDLSLAETAISQVINELTLSGVSPRDIAHLLSKASLNIKKAEYYKEG